MQEFKNEGKRKFGVVGFSDNSVVLSLASEMIKRKDPLNCAASFHSIPKDINRFAEIPISTPIQTHFSENSPNIDLIHELEKIWKDKLQARGGIHSHGLHSMEENVYLYPASVKKYENNYRRILPHHQRRRD